MGMARLSIKAALVGSVTDILSTNLLMIPLILYVIAHAPAQDEAVKRAVLVAIQTNPVYLAISMLVGSFCSVLGGYVAARIAKHDELLNGAASSFLCVLSGLYGIAFGDSHFPLWAEVLDIPTSVALAGLGGWIRLRQKNRAAVLTTVTTP